MLMVASLTTVIEPVSLTDSQGPVAVTVYGKEPAEVGVPLMVKFPPLKLPVTPAGKPDTVAPLPLPPMAKTIGSMAELMQISVCSLLEGELIEASGVMVTLIEVSAVGDVVQSRLLVITTRTVLLPSLRLLVVKVLEDDDCEGELLPLT